MSHAVRLRRRALVQALAALPVTAAAALPAASPVRIFHVMSYHSPWRWTDWQLEGFRDALGLPLQLRVFQMDNKRQSGPGLMEQMGARARAQIDQWKPDLLYVSDDVAAEHVARHYAGSQLPVVFSGVNADPAQYGLAGAPNLTGVLEQEHFVESVRLLQSMVPQARRLVVVVDPAPMWQPVLARMRAAAPRAGIEIVGWETIATWADYQARIGWWQDRADALALIGVFQFRDQNGRNLPYEQVLRWTAEHSRLPDLSFWEDRVRFGTLASVTVSEREQGLAAGRLARAILVDGQSPASLPMRPTAKGLPMISLARARRLGLQVRSGVLLSSSVFTHFEWEGHPR